MASLMILGMKTHNCKITVTAKLNTHEKVVNLCMNMACSCTLFAKLSQWRELAGFLKYTLFFHVQDTTSKKNPISKISRTLIVCGQS